MTIDSETPQITETRAFVCQDTGIEAELDKFEALVRAVHLAAKHLSIPFNSHVYSPKSDGVDGDAILACRTAIDEARCVATLKRGLLPGGINVDLRAILQFI